MGTGKGKPALFGDHLSPDGKPIKRFLGGGLTHFNPVDLRSGGAMVCPIQQSFYLGFGADGGNFNGAIGPIADIANNPQALSFSLGTVTKPDSLHYTMNNGLNGGHYRNGRDY
jgi:hypothetical protein